MLQGITVDISGCCDTMIETNTGKSVDEEEYMLIRMNREKMAGENLREGSIEVAFELWIEQNFLSRLQRSFPPLSGEAISEIIRYE